MPPSYRLVNFTLRPAKAVQRRMVIEICSRMSAFSNLLGFRYIGLGSPFFNDFASLHRRYGMTNMVCIERETRDEKRFSFNKPYECIEMKWGNSYEVLPALQWRGVPTIVWMDYDDPISENVLSDVGTIVGEMEPGSMLLWTLQAEGKTFAADENSPLENLKESIGDYLPSSVVSRDMNGKAFQRLLHTILTNEIDRVLSQRNSGLPISNRIHYEQVLNILYSDGVRMTTMGGVLYRGDQQQRLANCEFGDFNFVRTQATPLEIKVPVLTHREQLALSSTLPFGDPIDDLLEESDLNAYRSLYRYYPAFVEADL